MNTIESAALLKRWVVSWQPSGGVAELLLSVFGSVSNLQLEIG